MPCNLINKILKLECMWCDNCMTSQKFEFAQFICSQSVIFAIIFLNLWLLMLIPPEHSWIESSEMAVKRHTPLPLAVYWLTVDEEEGALIPATPFLPFTARKRSNHKSVHLHTQFLLSLHQTRLHVMVCECVLDEQFTTTTEEGAVMTLLQFITMPPCLVG